MTPDLQGREAFLQGMAGLGVDVSRETTDRLQVLVDTLRRWQTTINLVSRSTMDEVWTRHILDSAQIAPLIPSAARSLLDLGSGAGFPGLVVAAVLPNLEVTLIEADARKAAFLGEASRRMALERPPRIMVGRAETVRPIHPDVITARALAPLPKLLEWAALHRSDPTICLFHKGKGWQTELTEAMKSWDIPCHPSSSLTDLDAVILRIGRYTPRGAGR